MNGMPRKLYLAAYDVRQPGRLTAALRTVRAYASGGQKSAYECWLTDSEFTELTLAMSVVLEPDADSFMLIPLDPRRPMTALGVAAPPVDPAFFYIG